jgi:hypothetical protein
MAGTSFYHSIPGSSAVLPSGRIVAFDYSGQLDVEEGDEEGMKFFSEIADKRGSMVVSTKEAATAEPTAKVAAEEVKNKAAKVAQTVADAQPK